MVSGRWVLLIPPDQIDDKFIFNSTEKTKAFNGKGTYSSYTQKEREDSCHKL